MKMKKLCALITATAITMTLLAGCGGNDTTTTTVDSGNTGETDTGGNTVETPVESGEITEFSMFIAMPDAEINDDNEIQQIIAEKTGVKVKETWLTGQTDAEAIGMIIASGEYPDYINGSDSMMALYEAGALVAWDDYLDQYPNLKAFYTDEQWDKFRQADGKIYWANVFQNIHGEDKTTTINGEAVWVQAKVLEWAGYPDINTLDQYFDLLRDYAAANPTMEDGTENIPYTILCEDWRYFCLENAPEFLDGYPNDGSVIVDTDTMTVKDYNTTETAKRYFQKLNEEYKAGLVDPESFTQTYDEYIAKLSTGRVLGMIDQWWDFAYDVNDSFKQQGLDLQGCNYVPLGLTIDEGMANQWYTPGGEMNVSSGIAITTSCQDIEKAFQFMNDCLDQEIHDLRFWGVEGVDYLVDEDGLYYRTDEMRMQWADTSYKASHECLYTYFPRYLGTSTDGINAMEPTEQPSDFRANLAEPLKKLFDAYGIDTYVEMVGSTGPSSKEMSWFPMYSYSNTMTTATPGGMAFEKSKEVKHEWLPKVVMATDFDSAWEEYLGVYATTNPEDFLAEMQAELDRRVGN